jgi:hypothetical protein
MKRKINIDRMQIRVRGVAPQVVRAATGDLGHELMQRLAAPSAISRKGQVRVDQVECGTLKGDAETAAELRERMVNRIVSSIAAKLK